MNGVVLWVAVLEVFVGLEMVDLSGKSLVGMAVLENMRGVLGKVECPGILKDLRPVLEMTRGDLDKAIFLGYSVSRTELVFCVEVEGDRVAVGV